MPEPTPAELAAEEARDLVDEMSLDLYRAQDAIEFVREMCALREKSQKASAGQGEVQTGEILDWLKGPQCGRQMLAAQSADTPVPPPDGVRDQIAAAIRDAACTGDCGKTEDECARERIQPFAWHHGKLAIVEGSPEQFADAVLRAPAIRDMQAQAARLEPAIIEQERLADNHRRLGIELEHWQTVIVPELRQKVEQQRKLIEIWQEQARHVTTRAEQAEDLLRIAHDTSNKSEAERARAVQRAEQAEAALGRVVALATSDRYRIVGQHFLAALDSQEQP